MLTVRINDTDYQTDVTPDTPLLWVLRDVLGLTGTKFGCGIAECGACTVHVDGKAVRACSLPVGLLNGRPVTTIEGIGSDPLGQAVQMAWMEIDVVQCGYCQPGQIMSAIALLRDNPHPTDADIDAAMSGNICRCGTYLRIRQAIHNAAGLIT
ncbi:2Fe-2S iron-sulfur cluster binding domain-containing protein [Acetobacter musti]|uniref:2Fe-2S iron-sulfur cluster binding domain-containing protein n=1 Tax=Acetobacter musti TaxID=864732 RepID=A0ABX0JHE9_9PROT|nr:(2Fe-2S)-binding protein [Acetobacter musti]NHN83221.1 2Fe-2S iron-sulfur cluster binding domain-containing protein [Acetobacter musti]